MAPSPAAANRGRVVPTHLRILRARDHLARARPARRRRRGPLLLPGAFRPSRSPATAPDRVRAAAPRAKPQVDASARPSPDPPRHVATPIRAPRRRAPPPVGVCSRRRHRQLRPSPGASPSSRSPRTGTIEPIKTTRDKAQQGADPGDRAPRGPAPRGTRRSRRTPRVAPREGAAAAQRGVSPGRHGPMRCATRDVSAVNRTTLDVSGKTSDDSTASTGKARRTTSPPTPSEEGIVEGIREEGILVIRQEGVEEDGG